MENYGKKQKLEKKENWKIWKEKNGQKKVKEKQRHNRDLGLNIIRCKKNKKR